MKIQLRNITDLLVAENFPGQNASDLLVLREQLMDRLGTDEAFKAPILWACKYQGTIDHEDSDGFRYYKFTEDDCQRGTLPLSTLGHPAPRGMINKQCVYGFTTRADHCGFGSNLLWEVDETRIKYRYQGYETDPVSGQVM